MRGVMTRFEEWVRVGRSHYGEGGLSPLNPHQIEMSIRRFFCFGQFCYTGAFQKSLARFRIERFGGEAALNREGIGHHAFKDRIIQQLWINFRLHVGSLQDVRVQINSSIHANGSSAFSIRL